MRGEASDLLIANLGRCGHSLWSIMAVPCTLAIYRTSLSKRMPEVRNIEVPSRPIGRRLAEILLIVAVFFIVAGDPPPDVNESHYLCRLKYYWNPDWCPGDLFLESTDTQLLFIWLFGWITKWLSLTATAWVGRVAAWSLLAWAWQQLSWRIVPVPWAAVLSAALFISLNEGAHLAGEWIVGGVEAKCFAYGFVLLALCKLVDGNWNGLLLPLGLATAFHPIVGGWSAVLCAGIWLIDGRRERSLLTMTPGLLAGLLVSLVGVVPAVSLTWDVPPEVAAEAARIYVFERLPHHLALLELPREEVMLRLARHSALLVTLAWLGVAMRHHKVFRILQFAWGAVALAIIGFLIELGLGHHPLLAARLLRYYWFRMTDFAAPMAVALAATALITIGLDQRKRWAPWALFAALLASGGHLSNALVPRLAHPVPPADARMVDVASWIDVCRWIAASTPQDSLFLTPRMNQSFKWRTGRPEVVNRKDIPQDARSILEWHKRLQEIYFDPAAPVSDGPINSLGVLDTQRVRELGLKYGADYVLADRTQLLSLPRAYWNAEYVVYRIEK